MMPAIDGVDLANQRSILIVYVKRAEAGICVIYIHKNGFLIRIRKEQPYVDRFEMAALYFPDKLAAAVYAHQRFAAAACQHKTRIFRSFASAQQPNAVKVPLAEVDSSVNRPQQLSGVVKHRVAGGDLVNTIAVKINRIWLMGCELTARLFYVPQQLALARKCPDLRVACFQEDVIFIAIREIGKHDTIGSFRRRRGKSENFAACGSIQNDNMLPHNNHYLLAAVAIPVVYLARHVAVQCSHSLCRVAPIPKRGAVKTISADSDDRVDVIAVPKPSLNKLSHTITVNIACDSPRSGAIRRHGERVIRLYDRNRIVCTII